jgi:nitrate reductase NapAB chaperone NapD
MRCSVEDQPKVLGQLKQIPGIEIGDATAMGIPVATEASTTKAAAELGEKLQNLTGVKAAILVYHNFEDVADSIAAN